MIKLYSINIQAEELFSLIYHQTGNRHSLEDISIAEKEKGFIDIVSQYNYQFEYIFEKESNFSDTTWSKKHHKITKAFDNSLHFLRLLRNEKIDFKYELKESDMKILGSASPPLHAFIIEKFK